ncbi:MAG: RHS repeat-associated core domain-containing protein, partial [Gammaproteobacteria bacterium]|nr:RHS repeat-associated core domain-containing protein [Gammaproteobacteria bacterium]
LDISTNEKTHPTNTLHIGTHILTETTKDTIEGRYQLSSHLQSNALELNDKAQTISYEHYYPYGGTALIAGKDQTQVRQKRYRYTGKERDDSSGLSYYGARYLAPWMARWISPDSAGTIDGLNLYVYVRNNPLKYIDPTGHVKVNNKGVFYELDILKSISTTYQSKNLLHSSGAYQRLEETVRHFSINRPDEYQLLDTGIEFTVNPFFSNRKTVQAIFKQKGNTFNNTMDFETGELRFCVNNKAPSFNINATEMSSYQYLGMTRVAGVHNQLPKTFVRCSITNIKARAVIQTYRTDQDRIKFFREFVNETDNGRSSARVADALGLKITAIELDRNNVRLHLLPQEVLRPFGESIILPPRKT